MDVSIRFILPCNAAHFIQPSSAGAEGLQPHDSTQVSCHPPWLCLWLISFSHGLGDSFCPNSSQSKLSALPLLPGLSLTHPGGPIFSSYLHEQEQSPSDFHSLPEYPSLCPPLLSGLTIYTLPAANQVAKGLNRA